MPRGRMAASALAIGCALGCVLADTAAAQGTLPLVVAHIDAEALAGEWFEAATTGSFALRRCLSDTRHRVEVRSARTLQVYTACVTSRGVERRRGFLSGGKAGDGRYSLRYAPLVLSWAPAAWSDFWVLDAGDGWLLVGDRRRRTLSVLSRTVALAESDLAQAIAAARTRGFEPALLRTVSHPSGATGLVVGR